jgi:hypothetical protein
MHADVKVIDLSAYNSRKAVLLFAAAFHEFLLEGLGLIGR